MTDHRTSDEAWEDEMSSAFDRRVRDLHEAPLSLDQVRGKATRIRRKRRVAVAAGGLVAAAVITPIALVTANGQGDGGPNVPPATQPTKAVDTTPAEPEPPADALYIAGSELHLVDGSVEQLPSASYVNAVVQGEDRIVAFRRNPDGTQAVVDVIEDGEVVDSYRAGSDMVIGESGTVAFVDREGAVQTLWDGGTSVLADGYRFWTPVAVTGGPECDVPGTDCRVYLKSERTTEAPVAVSAGGTAETPVPDAVSITDATDAGLVSVAVDGGNFEYCSNVVDTARGREVLEQCDYRLDEFSPDARHTLGPDIQSDGLGPSAVYIVDTDGAVVATLDPGDGYVNRYQWIDDETIAATVYDYGSQSWSVQTMTLDGTVETVAGPVKGTGNDPSVEPAFYVVG